MPDPIIRAHQEWLGLIQPVGLVVAPAALVAAQVVLHATERTRWRAFGDVLEEDSDSGERRLLAFAPLAKQVLGWELEEVAGAPGGPPLPDGLTVALPELRTHLAPTWAIPEPDRAGEWQVLVKLEDPATSLDRAATGSAWTASPHDQFERLLRETNVPIGLLVNGSTIRLVYAPRGESSGYLSFPVGSMATVAGRPMFLALQELLKWWRLSRACPTESRLATVLRESRKYQNVVSTMLAEQVLGALYDLLRGFQSADEAASGRILQQVLREDPQEVYGGMLTSIMRFVFVLYAEERGMLPQEASWVEHYGAGSLYQKLADDRARHPDTMDQRFGAWARLLALARILHDGATHGDMRIPARAGELFDPDRYPFLEGRPHGTRRVKGERLTDLPRVSDGCVLRVLEHLLILDGERLSYRALDVEQIGSVYEAMMGFEVRAATGASVAVIPKTRPKGSPGHPVLDLDALLAVAGSDREKWLKDACDCHLTGAAVPQLKTATSVEELLTAIERRRSPFTPLPVKRGGLTLHPTEERRRSGSHYTPRELTEPIVATTLRPVFEELGPEPTPEQILSLKVCDPAMGSGAFLVGACRFLGERLVAAWQRQGTMPEIPPDEDPQLFARRLVAQQCLYGVDRNRYAVQLAKLSLWLVTLAREHPFTFVDHALRHGDSLVGLTRRQIQTFHWAPGGGEEMQLWSPEIDRWMEEADAARAALEGLGDSDDTAEKRRLLADADSVLERVRRIGDAVVAAWFSAGSARAREQARGGNEQLVSAALSSGNLATLNDLSERLREGQVIPFHWAVEYPEVFRRDQPGFDAIIGNPPFAGKNTLIKSNPEYYLPWLQTIHEGAHGNSDLVAHFFRRSYGLLRTGGAFGLIATNTIAQGDTRATGLRGLRQQGCTLYEARRRYRWPGAAAVVVSVVHGVKGPYTGAKRLDGSSVDLITAFLFHRGSDDDPSRLPENMDKCFNGSILLGMGFTFDDTTEEATPLTEMYRLVASDARNQEVIHPYIGGEEVNNHPTHLHHRYAIDFFDRSLDEAAAYPELLSIVRARVKPQRDIQTRTALRERWWQYGEKRPGLYRAIRQLSSVLVVNCGATPHLAVTKLPTGMIYANTLSVFALDTHSAIAVLQSRIHELWAWFFGSSMKDDLRYTPTDCFETFPFPVGWQDSARLEHAGAEYYGFRARLMADRDEGLTKTYNRFNDPTDTTPETLRLRALHGEMDRAVLDAYAWTDLAPEAEFIPEFDEEEAEAATNARRKYRLRWPDEIRDEVLARLLELNRERAG